RSRDHCPLRPLVPAVWAQLPGPGRDDGGAQPPRRSRHHLALGAVLRAGIETPLPPEITPDQRVVEGRRDLLASTRSLSGVGQIKPPNWAIYSAPNLILRWRVSLPQVFESFRQGLLLHGAIAVAGVLREHELIMIVLGRELSRHEFIGDYVIVPHRV